MTKNFEKAFHELIMIEGGYVNDPTDRGGETKYGISQRAYPNVDISALTLEAAKRIYYRDYWCRLDLDSIPRYEIAAELFDTAVNMGVATAAKFLQRALNLMNRNQYNFPDLKEDGVIGVKTISAYKRVDERILLKVLNGLQFRRYAEICERDPSQEKYFNGWMQRV